MSRNDATAMKITFIDNHENNRVGAELELSDLYACKIPLQIKIHNGAQKTKKVEFASFEHAWCVRRMIRQPHVNQSHTIVTVANMEQIFVTTLADALCFLTQFERGGVFASWSSINVYYPMNLICTNAKGDHNIGLIARFVCSNNPKADGIRSRIRGYAADRWKNTGDLVARSIACCLWRGSPNLSAYKSGLAVVARAKYHNNVEIKNILCMTRGIPLQTTFDACSMVTMTRKKTCVAYMHTLSHLAKWLDWQLSPAMLMAFIMALHPRLGRDSILSCINLDTLLCIITPLIDTTQARRMQKFFNKTVSL